MKKLFKSLMVIALIFPSLSYSCDEHGLTGIMEENDLYIGPHEKGVSKVSYADFKDVIERITRLYEKDFEKRGLKLFIQDSWANGSVNAYAQRKGRTALVNMFGGIARHETMSKDSLALVTCHELGHHIGGTPKKERSGYGYGSSGRKVYTWASNEGQADYFASMKCLRRYFEREDNVKAIEDKEVPSFVRISCQNQFNSAEDVAICIRSALAGYSLANLFNSIRGRYSLLSFENKDPSRVLKTYDNHPAPQCRLDTYFAGALCDKDLYDEVSDSEVDKGVCSRREGYVIGVRPLCWFRPFYQ
ncbi:MAG: hypothetical protein VXY34_00835 [Bdellovibrionota bacterium]|nr:hypothetical protein [Bdellovibrionota bacterium]